MASLTQWTWIWANSRRQWRTGKPGVLQSTGFLRFRYNLWTEQQIRSPYALLVNWEIQTGNLPIAHISNAGQERAKWESRESKSFGFGFFFFFWFVCFLCAQRARDNTIWDMIAFTSCENWKHPWPRTLFLKLLWSGFTICNLNKLGWDTVDLMHYWLRNFLYCVKFFDNVPSKENIYGISRWPSGKEHACQCRRGGGCEFDPWVGKIPWKRKWHPSPVFLPRKIPWTEESGGLKSKGLQRVGHDWACMHIHMHIHKHTHTYIWT